MWIDTISVNFRGGNFRSHFRFSNKIQFLCPVEGPRPLCQASHGNFLHLQRFGPRGSRAVIAGGELTGDGREKKPTMAYYHMKLSYDL